MTKHKREIIGILFILLAVLVTVSLMSFDPTEEPTLSGSIAANNVMGIFGVYVSHYLVKMTIGWGSLAIPVILGWFGILLFSGGKLLPFIRHAAFLLVFGLLTGIGIASSQFLRHPDVLDFTYCGLMGGMIAAFLHDFVGLYGLLLIYVIAMLVLISAYFRWSMFTSLTAFGKGIQSAQIKISGWIVNFASWMKQKSEARKSLRHQAQPAMKTKKGTSKPEVKSVPPPIITDPEPIPESTIVEPELAPGTVSHDPLPETTEEESHQQDEEKERIPRMLEGIELDEMEVIKEGDPDKGKRGITQVLKYTIPPVDLLNHPPETSITISQEVLQEKADLLLHALKTFNVEGTIVRISPGPVITLYEIEPAEGVRVNKFTNLSDDLARIMKAERIRVIAPIPGLKTVGIELPNENPAIVAMRSIISSEKYIRSESKLTIAMGKTTKGDAYITDLAKMPHMLIAGATGSGKSICINTIIMSILYKAKPDEVKFIMIDPKKLELFTYKTLVGYHLITSPTLDEYVMTSAENAVGILNAALAEMERRYTLFAHSTVRSISEYHAKRKKNPELENVPYIVVVIDELADLMLTAGRDVEEPITRLAQMARAVGIHLVVATQRPSVDVITGLIKANFPARIAFQVSQKVDSRTIIDQMGAEKLLGKGDMLFLPPGTSEPFRLHNAYISTDEIEAIMAHIAKQPKPDEIMLPEVKEKAVKAEFTAEEDQDELLMEAAQLVVEQGQASVSLLQRRFRIGYSRAGRLIDELEALGVVAGYSGSKARDVLVESSYLDDLFK